VTVARSNRAGVAERICRSLFCEVVAVLSALDGYPAVTVSAPHITLGDFRLDLGPRITACHKCGNVANLYASHMIEFKNDKVRLTAVNTRMCHQIPADPCSIRCDARHVIPMDPLHLACVILTVALRFVCREARVAPRLKAMRMATAAGELSPGFEDAAPATSQEFIRTHAPARPPAGRVYGGELAETTTRLALRPPFAGI
jgi:hypothetical protein